MAWIALIVLVVLFFLFVRFARVNEGTAIALTSFGEFSKIIFRWKQHRMDEEWNIWKGSKSEEKPEEGSEDKKEIKYWSQKIFGGLIVYFWPFQKVHRYRHRWTDIRLREAEMEVEFHEEDLDNVLLKPAVYAFKLPAVETQPPERVPVNVLVLVTLRVQNPYLFLFVAPPTPVEDILARISAETRALVTSCGLDELLKLKGESLWEILKKAKVIEETLGKWGVKLAEKGIEIREINLPSEYQKAGAAKKTEEMKAAGRAEQIMGTVISSVATASGKERADVQKEFLENPQAFYQTHQSTIANTMNKLAMEGQAYLKIETPGATGFGGDLLRLIAAWKKMPTGLSEEIPIKESVEGEKKKTKEKEPKSILSILSSNPSKKLTLTKEENKKLKEELDKLPEKKKNEWLDWIAMATARGQIRIEKSNQK